MSTNLDYKTVFPPSVVRFIDEISSHYNISTDFLSASCLSVLATAAGRHFKVTDGRYVNPLVVWFVIVAPSGSNKSYALKLPVEPLRQIDSKLYEHYRDKLERYKVLVANKSSKTKQKKDSSDSDLPKEPVCKSIMVDDCTDEKRNEILFHSDNPLLSVYPEFGGFFADRARYSSDGTSAISRLLKLFDGDDIKVDRKSGSTMLIREPKFNILGDIQPEIMVKEFGRETFLRNGLNQRFLFAIDTECRVMERAVTEPDEAILNQWSETIKSIFEGHTDRRLFPVSLVRLSPEADEIYTRYYNEHQRRKIEIPGSYFGSIHSKLQIHILRFAGILHAAWLCNNPNRDPGIIGADIMERAWLVADYFETMALKVAEMLKVEQNVAEIDKDGLDSASRLTSRALLAAVVNRFGVKPSELVKLCGLGRYYGTRISNDVAKIQHK